MRGVIWLVLLVMTSGADETEDDDLGLGMQKLEFLAEELTLHECRELGKMLDSYKRNEGTDNEESCLDQLVKYQQELYPEGLDVVQSVLRHKLAQIGRRDLADWLARADCSKAPPKPRPTTCDESTTVKEESVSDEDDQWTYMDFAICTLATWAFLTLGWLVIQLIVINMKATVMASLI